MPEKSEAKSITRDKDIKQQFAQLNDEIHKIIVGYGEVIQSILIALFASGHVLLESIPGMGKTMMSKTIAEALRCEFKRLQCTPDLTATDILGGMKYNKETGEYNLEKGPIFTNILLVDEINRAQPKTQSALLEAMEEKKVTLGGKSYPLPEPFIVLATQNPLEQKGVFPLPEAQKDRFLFKSVLSFLSNEEEILIMKSKLTEEKINKVFNPAEILVIREEIKDSVFVSDSILEYAVRIVEETRNRKELSSGASPRASIAFMKTSKTKSFLEGRNYVSPSDIRKLAFPILRHRIILYPEYKEMRVTEDDIISKILQKVEAPID